MKTFLKLLAVFCLLVLAGGYFYVTSAGFQKKLVEQNLPAGSSIEHVKVTLSQLELSGLVLALEDGSTMAVGEVKTSFDPLAALLDDTIKLGAVNVSNVNVDMPSLKPFPKQAPVSTPVVSSAPSSTEVAEMETVAPAAAEELAKSPFDSLYELGEIPLLLDIESIHLDGQLKDGQANVYRFSVDANAIRPGQATEVVISLKSVFEKALQADLKTLDADAKLSFSQKASGGFEQLHHEKSISAKDSKGRNLMQYSQFFDLSINSADKRATVSMSFNADVPNPSVIMPELAMLGAVQLTGEAAAEIQGDVVTLNTADIQASSNGAEMLVAELKKSMTLGAKQNFAGELLELRISQLPMAWVNAGLPVNMGLAGEPITMVLSVTGEADGAMLVRSQAPIELNKVTFTMDGEERVQQLDLQLSPSLKVHADQTIEYDLLNLVVADRYGPFIEGQSSGRIDPNASVEGQAFAGVQSQTKFEVKLQPLVQQPALRGKTSIMGGVLNLNARIDGSVDYPIQVQTALLGLRARSLPGLTKDYRIAAQAQTLPSGAWRIGTNFQAGSDSRATSTFQLSGSVDPATTPLDFNLDLKGQRIRQNDLDVLAKAFAPYQAAERAVPTLEPSRPAAPQPSTPVASGPEPIVPPAWAGLNGKASVQIEALVLASGHLIEGVQAHALVTEPKLSLTDIAAQMGEGRIAGSSEVRYSARTATPYAVQADLNFKQVNPAIFSQPGKSFPISGLFNGRFKASGRGRSLESALDDAEGDLLITGSEGVVTAFQLDDRKQAGLGLVGFLGGALERPGLTAMARTVPYFKNIQFDEFVFELNRGADKRMVIPQLKILGDSLLIDASGVVAASSLSDVMNQPLDLTLQLGAKGVLTNYLETLGLLGEVTTEDGFRRWNRDVDIGGTLGKPNTEALMGILRNAASRALTQQPEPKQPAQSGPQIVSPGDAPAVEQPTELPQSQPQKLQPQQPKSKEERVIDDIGTALDLLKAFGN